MADKELFSTATNQDSFDSEESKILPLITKERTQKFELLLHLIPNLKQHLIVSGVTGIGKTLLLDMLYDIDSDGWQCCFVQGSAELSFEMIETQLTKAMLRNKHPSLESAFQDFKEQHKKIVLIIDDAGLLVSGLMTTLIEYAATQPALKLIFSLTPEARNNHRKTDKALDACYLLEIPSLTKRQCAYFVRHLAAKPRTYGTVAIDEKLLEKFYHDTHGVPARIIADYKKLSRENEKSDTKWIIVGAVGLLVLAIVINQSVRYFKKESLESEPVSSIEKIENTKEIEKLPSVSKDKATAAPTTESEIKNDTDIVIPEFKLDIEKGIAPAPVNTNSEATPINPKVEIPPIEKTPEVVAEPPPVIPVVEPEKIAEPTVQPTPEPEKIVELPAKIPESVKVETIPAPPFIIEPVKPITPPIISFPKVEPAQGMKIQPLLEKPMIQAVPIAAPEIKEKKIEPKTELKQEVKEVKIEPVKKAEVKVEPVKKVEIKQVEKPVEVKKPEPVKVEPVKKVELKSTKEKVEKNVEKEKTETVVPPSAAKYTLQLITLSNEQGMENFKKKHSALSKNFHVVKSVTNGQERFALMYGGFSSPEEAVKARKTLPSEFASALPRKQN